MTRRKENTTAGQGSPLSAQFWSCVQHGFACGLQWNRAGCSPQGAPRRAVSWKMEMCLRKQWVLCCLWDFLQPGVTRCDGRLGGPPSCFCSCVSLQERVYIKQRINLHKGIYLSPGKIHTKTWKVKAALITQEGFKAQQFTRIEGFIGKQWFSCVTPGNKPI